MFTLGSILGHTKLLALAGVTAASLAVAPTAVRAYEASHNPDATRPDNGDPNANSDQGQNDGSRQDGDRTANHRSDSDHANFDRQHGDREGFSPYGNPGLNNDRPDFRRQDPRGSRNGVDCGEPRFHPLAEGRSQDHFTCNITFTRSHHRA
jgi:hypothetical protein